MQTAASNSLVLTDISSLGRFGDSQTTISHGGFYQLIALGLIRSVHTQEVLTALGDRLVAMAEHAHAFRQMDTLEQVSRVLASSSLPRQYEAVGRYYQALSIQRFGRGNVEQAAQLLERVAENAPPRYRLKALVSLGANSVHRSEYRSASSFYRDAGSFALRQRLYDPHAVVVSPKDIAVIQSLEGDHRGALALLENLFPLAHAMRAVQPQVYFDYMNSLAVEFCAVGRLEEARNVSQIVLASPFAGAYPEWRETRDEIELRGYRASRSVVALNQRSADNALGPTSADATLGQTTAESTLGQTTADPTLGLSTGGAATVAEAPECGKLVRLPERSESLCAVSPSPAGRRATVLDMQEWKSKVPERKTRKDREARRGWLQKLHAGDLVPIIWGRIGDDDVDDDLLREVVLLLGAPEPDEDPGA